MTNSDELACAVERLASLLERTPDLIEVLKEALGRISLRPTSIGCYDNDDIITTAELAALLRLSSDAAREWAARWGVRASGHNRWPVRRIRLGLRREAITGGRRQRRPGTK